MKNATLVAGLLLVFTGGLPAASSGASFTPLGDYDGLTFTSAYAVSADGSTVVGTGLFNQAYRWTAATGTVPISGPVGGQFNVARAISADGTVVVGNGRPSPGSLAVNEAYVWSAGGTTSLGDLPGGAVSGIATGVSADGTVMAGTGASAAGQPYEAFRWTSGTGLVGLGDLPGGSFSSQATGISDDGQVIVGTGTSESPVQPQSRAYQQAFRWTESGGMVGLGDLDGGDYWSIALATSANGEVIVGTSAAAGGDQAFRWTAAGGMVRIDGLAGYDSHRASAVSGDGSIIGGNSTRLGSPPTFESQSDAFIWQEGQGAQKLFDLLVSQGATGLEGWRLVSVQDISADGQWVVGEGINPAGVSQAFRAQISAVPAPASIWLALTGLASLWRHRRIRRLAVASSA